MKKHIIILAFAGLLFNNPTSSAQETNELTIPISDPNKRANLSVQLNYGSINVKGTPRKDVLVKYSPVEKENKQEAQGTEGLRKISNGTINLEVSENSNSIIVKSGSWNMGLNLELEVPSGIDLKLHTHNNGVLTVSNVNGEIDLSNYNGPIYASGISGAVLANSYNGEIKVSFDKVKEGAPMSFSTYNGNVDLSFPANLKASMKIKTNRGEVYTDFGMNMTKSEPVQQRDEKSGTFKVVIDDWLKGELNGGGPEFMMKTYNGNIYMRKK